MVFSPLKIGFVGGGMMAQVGHIPFYANDPRCDVVAICEQRPSLIAALRDRFPTARIVTESQSLYADPAIDAVVVSLPRLATGPLVLAALEAGKHVISEKPMAHTLDQAARLVGEAKRRGLKYHIGFMKRYDPGIRVAKRVLSDLLADNRCGRLLAARFYNFAADYAVAPPAHTRPSESRESRFPVWPVTPDWLDAKHAQGYGWFMNAYCHDINLMRHFLGDEFEVRGATSPSPGALTAALRTGDIAVGFDVARTAAGRWIEGAEFLFERGRLDVALPSPMDTQGAATVRLEDRDASPQLVTFDVPRGWCFEEQAKAFIGELAGEGTSLSSGEGSLADLALTETIWRHVNE